MHFQNKKSLKSAIRYDTDLRLFWHLSSMRFWLSMSLGCPTVLPCAAPVRPVWQGLHLPGPVYGCRYRRRFGNGIRNIYSMAPYMPYITLQTWHPLYTNPAEARVLQPPTPAGTPSFSYPNLCINSPLLSFGSNHVDFGGISIPASATSSSS